MNRIIKIISVIVAQVILINLAITYGQELQESKTDIEEICKPVYNSGLLDGGKEVREYYERLRPEIHNKGFDLGYSAAESEYRLSMKQLNDQWKKDIAQARLDGIGRGIEIGKLSCNQ